MNIRGADALGLPSVEPYQSLRDQVTQALHSAVVTGELRPGVVYSAPALAADFGVSATPVREAMLDLAKEGLIEIVRNKGFRIVELSEQDMAEFAEVRELLEIPAVVLVAARADPHDLEALRDAAEETVRAAIEGDVLGYLEADHEFHHEMLALHGNRHLVVTVRDLRRRARLFGVTALVEAGRLVDSAKEHGQLLDAMLARDLPVVRELAALHIGRVRQLVTPPAQET